MNLGSCDHCGKLMEIADCIQYEDGKFFCSKKCAEEYRPGWNKKIPDNQLEFHTATGESYYG